VEAEYGDTVVQGSILTLAHHGARSGRPCPCSLDFSNLGVDTIGISHVDLDTLGGVMAISGIKPVEGFEGLGWYRTSFWAAAAFVDLNGVHKLHLCSEVSDEVGDLTVLDLLNAYWAFSESGAGRIYPPRDGSAVEVDLSRHFEVICTLLGAGPYITDQFTSLIEAGRSWAAAKAALEEASFVATAGDVVVRSAEAFINHLYGHGTAVYKAVVGFNLKTNAITVSLADPVPGVSCKDFVQTIWTDTDEKGNLLAGGHAGIAGSPRNRILTLEDAKEVAIKLDALLG
jgi:hypothetical protein